MLYGQRFIAKLGHAALCVDRCLGHSGIFIGFPNLTCHLLFSWGAEWQLVLCMAAVMNGKLSGYKIPMFSKPVHFPTDCEADLHVQQRSEFSRIYANRCIYCKKIYSPNSYCFQIRLFTMPCCSYLFYSVKKLCRCICLVVDLVESNIFLPFW